jgi:hypothetical protein
MECCKKLNDHHSSLVCFIVFVKDRFISVSSYVISLDQLFWFIISLVDLAKKDDRIYWFVFQVTISFSHERKTRLRLYSEEWE